MTMSRLLTRRGSLQAGAGLALSVVAAGGAARAATDRHPKWIVDSQSHIWSGGKPSATQRQTPFSADDLLQDLDSAGVQRAVIITPSWNPNGNELPLQAAAAHPDRLRVMGYFNVAAAPNPDAVAHWKDRKYMMGVRLFLASPAGHAWMNSSASDWLWPILADHDIPLMIYAGGMMPSLAKVAQRYPHLKICMDSFGAAPNVVGPAAFADYQPVLAMAKYPNISIKLASISYMAHEPYPYPGMQPVLHRIYDHFGPARMIWGSDATLMKDPYKNCVTAFTEETPWLSRHDLALIMGRNISNFIGWPLPA